MPGRFADAGIRSGRAEFGNERAHGGSVNGSHFRGDISLFTSRYSRRRWLTRVREVVDTAASVCWSHAQRHPRSLHC
jgi:hypothetical protein